MALLVAAGYGLGEWGKVGIHLMLPSGKCVHNYGESHCFKWESSLFQWPCFMATLNYQVPFVVAMIVPTLGFQWTSLTSCMSPATAGGECFHIPRTWDDA